MPDANDSDLPEPIRRVYSEEEKLARRWRLWRTVVCFVSSYSLLHKLIVPTILKFTVLKTSPYSKIDPMFIFLLLLFASFFRAKEMNFFRSVLGGVGISHGVFEVFDVLQGNAVGWLAISHLLSSVPLAVVCGYLMSQKSLGRNLKAAWCGAIGYALVCTPLLLFHPGETTKGKINQVRKGRN